MKIKPERIRKIIEEIDDVLLLLKQAETEHQSSVEFVDPSFSKGAKNLIHYGTFRSLDLLKLQKKLRNFGLSILDGTESHVEASLLNCKNILRALIQENINTNVPNRGSIKSAVKKQKKHAKDLFGYRSKGRRVRIMLTLPTQAAFNYALVRDLVAAGMNVARINCAHDNAEIWNLMIQNVQKATLELRKKCKIFMDLAGPKLRTILLDEDVRIRKFKPIRNAVGEVIQPAQIVLVSNQRLNNSQNELPVDPQLLQLLVVGDSIEFKDARKKKRKLIVKTITKNRVTAECGKTSYIKTGTRLRLKSSRKECIVGLLPRLSASLLLQKRDLLRVVNHQLLIGLKTASIAQSETKNVPVIACTAQEIFDAVKIGDRILFDDGKIEGIIKNTIPSELLVEITQAKRQGSKLKSDKGINLPDSNLNYAGLTHKDKQDLKFVAHHADAVNVSFVQTADDVTELYAELDRIAAPKTLGVVLKIENQKAYKNLYAILLEGMKRYPLGVMIARGDLAIEAGWENMPRIQNEILRMCDAAYVPTVWATQVLENMAKKGIPSRSELTDVASSLKADCVMLNKGDYILEAMQLLHRILSNMNSYRDKDERMFETISTK